MQIKGIQGLSVREIQEEVHAGGKFVVYTYCFSLILISFKRSSPICFVRHAENAFLKGLPYTIISFLFGWWGIPWGIIYTVGALVTNIRGGKDLTGAVMQSILSTKDRPVFEFETA